MNGIMTQKKNAGSILFPVLGSRLQTARKKRGLTQERLAEVLQVDTLTVRRYEIGDTLPPLNRLDEIARTLDVGVDYLLGFDQKERGGKRGREEALLLDQWRLLDADERKLILALVHKFNR